eukprot:650270-Rhodomonas_salina.1
MQRWCTELGYAAMAGCAMGFCLFANVAAGLEGTWPDGTGEAVGRMDRGGEGGRMGGGRWEDGRMGGDCLLYTSPSPRDRG